jgi:hypothetical protein
MSSDTRTAPISSLDVLRKDGFGQRSVVVALLAVVIVLDQATKWWGWRHFPYAIINDGGNRLVGSTVSGWFAGPVTGVLLDFLDLGLVSVAASVLVRRRRPAVVLVSGALMMAGWGSDLLDRLGMHYLTAPGAPRGAVDFVHIGSVYYNVADFVIVGATPLFLLAVGYQGWRATNGPAMTGSVVQASHRRRRLRARMLALVGAVCFMVVVAVEAAS